MRRKDKKEKVESQDNDLDFYVRRPRKQIKTKIRVVKINQYKPKIF